MFDSRRVSVLFAHRRSYYFGLPVEVFDARRDARAFGGAGPVVAHPPCRGWSRLRGLSRAGGEELALGRWAVGVVLRNGGVLEQPAHSRLWHVEGLPLPGKEGRRGFCLAVDQWVWGHPVRKPTWLFVVGCGFGDVPELNPRGLGLKDQVGYMNELGVDLNRRRLELNDLVARLRARGVGMNARAAFVNEAAPSGVCRLTPDQRELTPPAFCWWLEELAARCRGGGW